MRPHDSRAFALDVASEFDVSVGRPRRIDLHCHSSASNRSDEALLNAIRCPESYSSPADVFAQARSRGMDVVTITDHDTIDGIASLVQGGERSFDTAGMDLLVGEELTCWFPEDRCKIHLLLWGITPGDHADLQAVAHDIYAVADIVEQRRIAHAVAHPVYRQNDVLERWHLERLILLFKGFETLNGAHSALHRRSLEPVLDQLTPEGIDALADAHGLRPLWPEPWIKTRTGGSDDHGLLNIGLTYTEFDADARTVPDLLECLRTARCRPGGEAGSSVKLAHNLMSVGIHYAARQVRPRSASAASSASAGMMQMLVGEHPRATGRRRAAIAIAVKRTGGRLRRVFVRSKSGGTSARTGSTLLADLIAASCSNRIAEHPAIHQAVKSGVAPLSEHAAMFAFMAAVQRDVSGGIAESVADALSDGRIGAIFDAFAAILMQQCIQLPYYFSLAHQNRERNDLARITGQGRVPTRENLRVGVFTDTFDDVNGVVRFIREMGDEAAVRQLALTVHTCSSEPSFDAPYRKNFMPLVERGMPFYPDLTLTLPPIVEILEWADRQQFDAVHVDTPGPMGLCGWLVAKLLRIPVLGTYHTDFPAYVRHLSGGDFRMTAATSGYVGWFYGQMAAVLSRSLAYREQLGDLGIPDDRITAAPPCVDTATFNPRHRDVRIWAGLGVHEPLRLFFCARLSQEKNVAFLASVFQAICATRRDVALVIAGDGPCAASLGEALAGLPAYLLGRQDDAALARLYASADLFVFPSRTDTLGQVILEALASGLPTLVSDEGGPREIVNDNRTGRVLSAADPAHDVPLWVGVIEDLLRDEPRRRRLGRNAADRMARYTASAAFDAFWEAHLRAAVGVVGAESPALAEAVGLVETRSKYRYGEV